MDAKELAQSVSVNTEEETRREMQRIIDTYIRYVEQNLYYLKKKNKKLKRIIDTYIQYLRPILVYETHIYYLKIIYTYISLIFLIPM